MDYGQLIVILSRLLSGAIVTFLAIILWSGTRDPAWMLIVAGAIIRYGEVMYLTLELFGITQKDWLTIAGIPMVNFVFDNLPNLLFIIAFSIIILRNRVKIASFSKGNLVKKEKIKEKKQKKEKIKDKKNEHPGEIKEQEGSAQKQVVTEESPAQEMEEMEKS